MRIERIGKVPKLKPRLERFFVEALDGVAMDDVQHPEARKVDYRCLRGLLAIELKCLEEDASERIDNLTDELRERDDWPEFLGSAPIQSFLNQIDEPEEVKRRFLDRLGRAIKNHIHKANKQLKTHEEDFPRKNMVKVVVLANEDHEIYDPEMVAYIVQHLLLRQEKGAPLYPHIDAVIFLSERHAATIQRQIAFPMVSIEGASIEGALWKRDVTELFLVRWASWNGVPLYRADPREQKFTTIDHIPEQMRRQEKWELDYRRNPYMAGYSDEQLRERFDEINCISTLAFIKGSPIKPDKDAIMQSMSVMSHMMIEMGRRGIPAPQFRLEPARLAKAAERLGMPPHVVDWFRRDIGHAA
ncbi:MAG: hypothetical protein FD160_498 [Caulobacteraceae bacterium]|nr:MAG: hypothetical protein FD160_498 [Caulobacteraceae bacterium]